MNSFQPVDIKALNDNFFTRIGKEWSLITAGNADKCNTMTASWGGVGVLWNKDVVFSFIRKSRYTLEFVNNNDYYTVSFFGGDCMKELAYCGKVSGRDADKIAQTGLTPVFDREAPYFAQADLVLICKKLYQQTMNADSFFDKADVEKFYGDNDWHDIIVGEIVAALKKS